VEPSSRSRSRRQLGRTGTGDMSENSMLHAWDVCQDRSNGPRANSMMASSIRAVEVCPAVEGAGSITRGPGTYSAPSIWPSPQQQRSTSGAPPFRNLNRSNQSFHYRKKNYRRLQINRIYRKYQIKFKIFKIFGRISLETASNPLVITDCI
jgi:hypothetical protein